MPNETFINVDKGNTQRHFSGTFQFHQHMELAFRQWMKPGGKSSNQYQ